MPAPRFGKMSAAAQSAEMCIRDRYIWEKDFGVVDKLIEQNYNSRKDRKSVV